MDTENLGEPSRIRMSRRDFPRKVKAQAILRANGCCEACSAKLKVGEAEVDHILPDALGGEPILSNARVLCRVCHRTKTDQDIGRIRKADRQRDCAELRAALRECQRTLAMMVAPESVRQTTVAAAYASCVAAEAKARKLLGGCDGSA